MTFQVGGQGGIPSSGVGEVALNVVAGSGTATGFVTAYPAGATKPTATNVNYLAGQTIANLVVVPLSSAGKVTLYNQSSGTVQLIVDTQGYVTSGTGTAAGTYNPVTPSRFLNTGAGVGVAMGPVAAHSSVTVQVSGKGNIPSSGVGTVWFNLTAGSGSVGGSLTVYPAGASRPATANVSYGAAHPIGVLVAVALGTSGRVTIYNQSSGTVQLIGDTQGYTVAGTGATGSYRAVTAARFLDTSAGLGAAKHSIAAGGTVTVTVAGHGGIPATGVDTAVLDLSVGSSTQKGFVTAYRAGQSGRSGADLDFAAGQSVTNLVAVPLGGAGQVTIYNGSTGTVQVTADTAGYFLSPSWHPQALPLNEPGPASLGGISGISCASTTHCVAVGNYSSGSIDRSFAATLASGSWTIARLPELTDHSSLDAISCATTTHCVAVGTVDNNDGFGTSSFLIDTLEAGTWSSQEVDPDGIFGELRDVSCRSTTQCTAVGYKLQSYEVGEYDGIAAVLNGTSWTTTDVAPNDGIDSLDFTSVSCGSAGHCTILGGYISADDGSEAQQIWRQSGSSFSDTEVHDPNDSTNGPDLTTLSCLSTGNCTAIGEGQAGWLVASISTSSVSFQHPLATGPGADVSCPSATVCTAVGGAKAAILSGTTWTAQTLPAPSGGSSPSLPAVSCPSTTSCVAAGTYLDSSGHPRLMAATRSSGTWSAVSLPALVGPTIASLSAVSCGTASTCAAVGQYINSANHQIPLTALLSGGSWTTHALALPSGASSAQLAAVSCAGSSCVAVGSYVRSSDSVTRPFAEILSGTTWTYSATPTGPTTALSLASVTCLSATSCIAVGSGFAEKLSGSTWTYAAISGKPNLHSVSCQSLTSCVAVSDYQAETLSGTTWTERDVDNPSDGSTLYHLKSVSCVSTTQCTAVGTYEYNLEQEGDYEAPLITTFSGGSWTEVNAEDANYAGVVCSAAATCVLAGNAQDANDNGTTLTLERLSGTSLTALPPGALAGSVRSFAGGLACVDPNHCSAVGQSLQSPTFDQLPLVETLS